MKRLTRGKMYLLLMRRDPSTTFNDNQYNITGTAKWSVGTARCDGELADLRHLVRKDGATENAVGPCGAIGAPMTRTESTNLH